MRIVVIEDNEALATAIRNALEDRGFVVDWVDDGLEGEAFLAHSSADLVILDLNLPGQSGLEVLHSLRRRRVATPVLILTANGRTCDRVEGLEAGADDYLVKPFEMEELIARLRALARRPLAMRDNVEEIGAVRFDHDRRRLSLGDAAVELPRRELGLFECLLTNRGRIVSRSTIADALYGTGADVEENAIDLLVSRLRRKLEGTGVSIRTARGLGYMLDGEGR